MSIFYAENINDIINPEQAVGKISLENIYSQVYNVSKSTALKMAIEYTNKLNEKKQED